MGTKLNQKEIDALMEKEKNAKILKALNKKKHIFENDKIIRKND